AIPLIGGRKESGRRANPRAQANKQGPANYCVRPLRCRPGRAQREPGPIITEQSMVHGVWVPAFAGTTIERPGCSASRVLRLCPRKGYREDRGRGDTCRVRSDEGTLHYVRTGVGKGQT